MSEGSIAEMVLEYGGVDADGYYDHDTMMSNIMAECGDDAAADDGGHAATAFSYSNDDGSFYHSREDGSSHYSNGDGYNRATDAGGTVTESYYGNTMSR
tara:strand:- start:57 stop:353 length:297 start_codon:yes stop_codon:yes gene_type:complete